LEEKQNDTIPVSFSAVFSPFYTDTLPSKISVVEFLTHVKHETKIIIESQQQIYHREHINCTIKYAEKKTDEEINKQVKK
jgi:hypothetical protein